MEFVATYTPAPGESESTSAFGLTFLAGVPTKVDAGAYAKLRGHPHFVTAEPLPAVRPSRPARVRAAAREEAAVRAEAHAAELADAAGDASEEEGSEGSAL